MAKKEAGGPVYAVVGTGGGTLFYRCDLYPALNCVSRAQYLSAGWLVLTRVYGACRFGARVLTAAYGARLYNGFRAAPYAVSGTDKGVWYAGRQST
eukprot:3346199-Rhodomonas_salina.2